MSQIQLDFFNYSNRHIDLDINNLMNRAPSPLLDKRFDSRTL